MAGQGTTSVGSLLQFWRNARRLSQLALAAQAEVSPRHLSFIETGRARPSREMVLLLARTLDVPLRERNALLLAAGFAPVYPESPMEGPELSVVRGALEAILKQQEPFPAVVLNRSWDLVHANAAAVRFFAFLLGPRPADERTNLLRLMFHPEGVRPYVANWEEVAEELVRRVHRESVGGVVDESTRRLLTEILDYSGVPQGWKQPSLAAPLVPVLPVRFRKQGRAFDFFSTLTTLGTPQDITAQELRIECFFPANASTERAARELADQSVEASASP